MSREYYRRGRNWFTAMGALFCVMGGIVMVQQLLVWGADFAAEFLLNDNITHEKVSAGMIVFGVFMIGLGFRRHGKAG